ncbi:MAG: dephospho-CoA kinase [Oscillospiraceae bacterium]
MNKKLILGLTGPSGSGKTTVCKIFETKSFMAISADDIYHKIIKPNNNCYNDILNFFGKDILDSNNLINRKMLSKIVFNDDKKLRVLNNISHKYVIKEIKKDIKKSSYNQIILDVPLLFESGCNKICNFTIGVIAEEQIRKNRIIKRDVITEKNADLRIKSQPKQSFYEKHCDYIIYNHDKSLEMLDIDIKKIMTNILGD